MNYAKYIDIPNWEQIRDDLIAFRNKRISEGVYDREDGKGLYGWWCHFEDEVEKELPLLLEAFDNMGLKMRQLILFVNTTNSLDVTDHNNPEAIFIHQDSEDSDEAEGFKQPKEIEWSTTFNPTTAINIPLEYCEGSSTLFYERINNLPEVYYPKYDCGGLDHNSVKEVFRFELNKPAVLKINVPHGVHNPHKEDRVVATFRFYNSIDHLLD